ncbi:SsgA family sporulation/cell division regulator [Streptomyces sp. NBC_01216]|uniref:SsgA family sporulation/cell division regulator n=1 Tax=Streptomyces sp. NBC_01216 TaxID=2903778 RepID=UPI002E130046|nr:SsgA family sporulation/cell division regulator [Streptomyces sp. NBC_01216]
MQDTVDAEVPMDFLPPDEHPCRVTVRMRYNSCDPLAVQLTIPLPDDSSVTWVFARELLAEGVDRSCGEGDVRIAPVGNGRPGQVLIRFRVREREARFATDADSLVAFLDRTGEVVPIGGEEQHPCFRWHLEAELKSIGRSSR